MSLFDDFDDWEKCGGTGCGMMHGCPDRKGDESKPDCQECKKDADQAIAKASRPIDWNTGA